MKAIGLFAGIGGIELGLQKAGIETESFCEIRYDAQAVLKKNFTNVPIHGDITTLKNIPATNILTAGFPCQDLSIAGKKKGMKGVNSSLISHVFRLIKGARKKSPDFLLIENVPYLLSLNKGEMIRLITQAVESLGYSWAYRVVDSRGFGIPQRRPRVIFLASKVVHPKNLLFSKDENSELGIEDRVIIEENLNYGFYWTEGRIGIGWAKNSVPPIKGGSELGIPSPPAIWLSQEHFFGTPTILDTERLQGFPENWTNVEIEGKKVSRWKLVGNAVNTSVSEWIGKKITAGKLDGPSDDKVKKWSSGRWPMAAYSDNGNIYRVETSLFPELHELIPINSFVSHPLTPLSFRAASGFYKRVKESTLIKYHDEFVSSLEHYIQHYDNG